MTAIGFTVPGRPRTWQHTGGVGGARGVRLDARGKEAKAYQGHVALFALQALQRAKLAGIAWPDVTSNEPRFRVDVAAWWPDGNEGDADRLLNLVYDALQGVCFKSDRQVKVSSLALGEPGDEPHIRVFVRTLDDGDRDEHAARISYHVSAAIKVVHARTAALPMPASAGSSGGESGTGASRSRHTRSHGA